jgi:hypothetical protein
LSRRTARHITGAQAIFKFGPQRSILSIERGRIPERRADAAPVRKEGGRKVRWREGKNSRPPVGGDLALIVFYFEATSFQEMD